ncbi:protein strawberry notch homolog 1-like [Limulus polyphemus]|uniref:Protein strawberry notch homolog 1-like n=1 Tax=Limulus polyphemus TaxID=6850 RepID=A0ABM1C4Q6_LIMPO|nr:protein strawberry notch homolog 1-like [Limulus polyphemus]
MDAHDLLSAALNQSGINSEDVATNDASRHHAASRYVHGFTQPSLHNFFGSPYSFPSGSSQSYFPGKMPTDQGYFPDKMSPSQGYFPGKMPVCDMPALNHHILASMLGNSHNPFPPNFMQHPAMIPNFTSKDLSKLWLNEGIKHNPFVKPEAETEEAEEEEELVHAETYNEYVPTKLKIGQRHPDPVVETSSLSSIPPPDISYKLSLDEEIIDRGLLSALQLEAIVYACQQHETFLPDGSRAGFLIGDGAGVGKGRTLAGIIYENYLLGRKRSIWLSVSNDLKYDSERDLQDIGAGKIEVYPLNKFKYAKISSKVNGSVKKGVIFATYSSLIGESQSGGKYKTRLKQLLNWCGEDFDGVIVFDECHKAKNLCPVGSSKPTKTGLTVLELQNSLPKARVVYASATGASEPKNMAYMTRLGIWGEGTTFNDFSDFISAVEKRGVGAMELVAMEMKQRGMYIARQLSFAGVSFKVEEIPLAQDFIEVYDRSVKLWVEAREKFQKSAELLEGDQRIKKSMWSQFWGSHQRFFKYLCIASKVKPAVALAREAVKNGKCIVIGLQSTGEARTLEQLEEAGGELTDFVSTAKGVLQTLIDKHFPAPDRKKMSRLLGLESFMKEEAKEIKRPISPVASSSCGGTKRKSARQARQLVKRYRESKLTDESNSEAEPEENDDSEFAPSDSNSSDREPSPSPTESEDDSDFNPFGEESDSDVPLWESDEFAYSQQWGLGFNSLKLTTSFDEFLTAFVA